MTALRTGFAGARVRLALPVLLAVLVAASLGWIAGMGIWILLPAVLVACVLAALVSRGPYALLLVWLASSTFVRTLVVDPGPGIPNLSVDRLLLLIAALLVCAQFVFTGRPLRHIGLESLCLVVFLGWAAVSVLVWRPIVLTTQFAVLLHEFILPFVTFWVVLQVVTSAKQIGRLLLVSTVVLILLSPPAAIEEITGVSILGETSQRAAGVVRVQSFTGASWELGAVAGMLLALSAHSLSIACGPRRWWLALGAVVLGTVAISLSFMRASWLALSMALLIMGTLNPRLRRFVFPALAVGVLIAIASWDRITSTEVWAIRVMDTRNVLSRYVVLRQQAQAFTQSPLLGHGLPLERDLWQAMGGSYIISHNTFASSLVDFGLFGLLPFAAMGVILVRSVRAFPRLPSGTLAGKELVVALWAVAVVYLIHAFSLEIRPFTSITMLFWFSMGLLRIVTEGSGSS